CSAICAGVTTSRVNATSPPRSSANAVTSSRRVMNAETPLASWSPTWSTSKGRSLSDTSTAKSYLLVKLSKPPLATTRTPYSWATRASCGAMPAASHHTKCFLARGAVEGDGRGLGADVLEELLAAGPSAGVEGGDGVVADRLRRNELGAPRQRRDFAQLVL